MASESSVFGFSVLAVIVGLVVLIVGEATPLDSLVWVGGAVVVIAVFAMAGHIARMPAAESDH